MITHSAVNLVLIRISILLLQYAPLIETALLLYFYQASPRNRPTSHSAAIIILQTLLAFEAIYYFNLYLPHKTRLLQTKATHPQPPLNRAQRQALFDKCASNIPDWESYIRGWFLNAPISEIKRDNVREFLLWAFFDIDSNDDATRELDPDTESHLDSLISQTESLLGRKFPPGRAGAATTKSLRLTIDPISIQYRSVLWYAVVALTDAITYLHLRHSGFTHHTPASDPDRPLSSSSSSFPPRLSHCRLFQPRHHARHHAAPTGTSYYLRPHPPGSADLPIVFLHGIGIGLWPYRDFLSALASSTDVGILALEHLPISSRLTSPPPTRSEFVSQISAILKAVGWDDGGFVLATHSYGSVLATHLLRSPEVSPRIRGLVLVDPVTVLLHLPDVAYNFTRRPPARANEWQLWYFASTDPGVAEGLGRYFFWRENIIWKEELLTITPTPTPTPTPAQSGPGEKSEKKRNVAVALAGRDLIVDTATVKKYLADNDGEKGLQETNDGKICGGGDSTPSGIEILWFPDIDHAQVFERPKDMQKVVDVVKRFCVSERN
ncbi:Alpha/Beta hydrolase protein [Cladorrhinum samala]|uniref:Alpha/Beta hydrolase protein n=1 Tax=Cladorrhinum samala TaxID=585594 RepID=A0AAV9HXX3_9PEZI|nr:Alpha/Beta hydrolase protein [Cladorrhinum samala]